MKKVVMTKEEKVELFEKVYALEKNSIEEEIFADTYNEDTSAYRAFRNGMHEVLNMFGVCYEYFDWKRSGHRWVIEGEGVL